jgi:hypothetical protein
MQIRESGRDGVSIRSITKDSFTMLFISVQLVVSQEEISELNARAVLQMRAEASERNWSNETQGAGANLT